MIVVYQDNQKLLKSIISLTVPSLLECALQTLVSYVDYIMAGKLGIEVSATIGLTNEVSFLIKGRINAVGIDALSYISYSIDAKRLEKIKIAVVQSFYLAVVVDLISYILSLAISPFLPIWLGTDSVIQDNFSKYFAIVSSSFIFFQ